MAGKLSDALAIAFFTRGVELQNFDGAVNLGDMPPLGRGAKCDRALAADHDERADRSLCAGGICARPGVRPDQAVRAALLARSFR